eukprot:1136471-Pelagomonas_calceolata.AAC.17
MGGVQLLLTLQRHGPQSRVFIHGRSACMCGLAGATCAQDNDGGAAAADARDAAAALSRF